MRDLLVQCQILPAYDRHLDRFTTWLDTVLNSSRVPQSLDVVKQFATWKHLRTLRARAQGQPLPKGAARNARQEITVTKHYPTPTHIRKLGRSRLATRLSKKAPRMGARLADDIFTALSEQNVVIVGTSAAETIIPKLAEQLSSLQRRRSDVASKVEALVQAHPLHPVLTSLPGVGIRTAARIITETSGKHFATAGHLAAYAGLAPVTRRSGSSIRGEHRSQRGNKKLKRVLYL